MTLLTTLLQPEGKVAMTVCTATVFITLVTVIFDIRLTQTIT
jgi:hypothetical protein